MSSDIRPGMTSDMNQEATAEPILKMEKVSKAFGGVQALENVSVEVYPGDILGIIGPNGSGKTTIVNSITGFIKPTSGRVYFKKKEITGMKPHKIADMGVTRTFQIMRPYYSLPAYKNLV
ncbi:MAG: ATP-binding cassette domain-containing protein, partial [Thermodesulfobacteriota bacterium]